MMPANESGSDSAENNTSEAQAEAVYQLETPVLCPSCHKSVQSLRVVRMLRTRVNFTSTLPRRGRAIVCPACSVVVSAELGALS